MKRFLLGVVLVLSAGVLFAQSERGQAAIQEQQAEETEALRIYEYRLNETISPLKELIKLKKFNDKQYSQFIEVYDKFLQQTKGPDINLWFKYENEFIIPVKQKILSKKQLADFERYEQEPRAGRDPRDGYPMNERARRIQQGPEEYKREQENKNKGLRY